MRKQNLQILLIGSNGQIGLELRRSLTSLGSMLALDRAMLDFADPDAIRKVVRENRPDLIVNAAAYTDVDRAESEPSLAMAVNGTAPGVLAEEALRLNALLIHYSSDYVFDGIKRTPYLESDIPNPLNTYGKTKLAGELAIRATGVRHFTLRTSWVYSIHGKNFLTTILRLSKERQELHIVDDQIGAPTPAHVVANITARLVTCATDQDKNADLAHGVYHLTTSGEVSWFGFAQAILTRSAQPPPRPRLIPIAAKDYPSIAQRPANSRLDCRRLSQTLGIAMPPWQQGLEECLHQLHV